MILNYSSSKVFDLFGNLFNIWSTKYKYLYRNFQYLSNGNSIGLRDIAKWKDKQSSPPSLTASYFLDIPCEDWLAIHLYKCLSVFSLKIFAKAFWSVEQCLVLFYRIVRISSNDPFYFLIVFAIFCGEDKKHHLRSFCWQQRFHLKTSSSRKRSVHFKI